MRNLPEEQLFHKESLKLMDEEFTGETAIPMANTSSCTLINIGNIKIHKKSSEW
jgi:hypothetical protein